MGVYAYFACNICKVHVFVFKMLKTRVVRRNREYHHYYCDSLIVHCTIIIVLHAYVYIYKYISHSQPVAKTESTHTYGSLLYVNTKRYKHYNRPVMKCMFHVWQQVLIFVFSLNLQKLNRFYNYNPTRYVALNQ